MTRSNVSTQPTTLLSLSLFLLPVIILHWKQKLSTEKERKFRTERERERAFLATLANDPNSPPLRPPLPEIVRRVLGRCRFAYLSTMDVTSNTTHLSLMRFTYLHEEELILMSTNIHTKKFEILEKQSGVALLVHDFSEGCSIGDKNNMPNLTGEYSITLNGTCSVIKDVNIAEKYRSAHLKNNPDYPQFIVGKDIAMLRVDVVSARICNINDQVTKWNL